MIDVSKKQHKATQDVANVHQSTEGVQNVKLSQLPFQQATLIIILWLMERKKFISELLFKATWLHITYALRSIKTINNKQISASTDGVPRSWVCSRKTLRLAPHQH